MKCIRYWLLFVATILTCQSLVAQEPLRITTYNIKFLPSILLHIKHYPPRRAKLIPKHLIADSAHIIVFQEAFDHRCIKMLKRKMKQDYPYWIGPANNQVDFHVSSGVLICSKVPISHLAEIDFKECDKEDCMARKGGLLIETEWQGQRLQVMGTHLEAGGTKEMKRGQYYEIEAMMAKHRKVGVPQLYCGDMNTHKGRGPLYDTMMAVWNVLDGEFDGELKYTSDHLLNDMGKYRPDDRNIIDFILYRPNGVMYRSIMREVKQYEEQWHRKHKDLSDHFAVQADIWLNKPATP